MLTNGYMHDILISTKENIFHKVQKIISFLQDGRSLINVNIDQSSTRKKRRFTERQMNRDVEVHGTKENVERE